MSAPLSLAILSLSAAFAAATAVAAAAPPPVPAEASERAEWYVVIDGQQVGPLTASAVERRVAEGAACETSLVWREGMESWTPLGDTMTFKGRKVDAALKKPKGPTPLDNKFMAVRL